MSVNTVEEVRNVVLQRLHRGESFLALDITNMLRTQLSPVRHRDVADTIRDMFDAGIIEECGYARELDSLMTKDGLIVHAYRYYQQL